MSTLQPQNLIEHKPMEIIGLDGKPTGKWHYCGITEHSLDDSLARQCDANRPKEVRYVGDPDGLAFGIGHCVSADFCEPGEECLGHDTPEAALQHFKDYLFFLFEMEQPEKPDTKTDVVNDLQPDLIPNARLTRLQLDKAICHILGWEKRGPHNWYQEGKTERDWRRWSKMPDYTSDVELGQELLDLMKADGVVLRYDPRGKKWLVDFKRADRWYCVSHRDKAWVIACAFYQYKTGARVLRPKEFEESRSVDNVVPPHLMPSDGKSMTREWSTVTQTSKSPIAYKTPMNRTERTLSEIANDSNRTPEEQARLTEAYYNK